MKLFPLTRMEPYPYYLTNFGEYTLWQFAKYRFLKFLIGIKNFYYHEWLNAESKYPKLFLKLLFFITHRKPFYPYSFAKFINKKQAEAVKERIESEIRLNAKNF